MKPTVREHAPQRRVLATCVDATMRLLHPVMPFVTEKLWERLNEVAPTRGVDHLALPPSELLIEAAWPRVESPLIDVEAEARFSQIQQVVTALREVRTTHKVPPRQRVECSMKGSEEVTEPLAEHRQIIGTLAGADFVAIGPAVERPVNSGTTAVGEIEIYVHDLVDAEAERGRLERRLEEVRKRVGMLQGRLANKSYVDRAPAHLVSETRDQLSEAEKEVAALEQKLAE